MLYKKNQHQLLLVILFFNKTNFIRPWKIKYLFEITSILQSQRSSDILVLD